MQLGEIRDEKVITEYVALLDHAIAAAMLLKREPCHSRDVPLLNLVIDRLERIIAETQKGRIVNDIVGMTKFVDEWPIDRARLALAIWDVEKYFGEKLLREAMG